MIISELVRKWFGLDPITCSSCEVLRSELENSNRERRELLNRLLDRGQPKIVPEDKTEYKPIQPQFVPWRIRQQMLEAEDAKKAELMKARAQEVEKLEKELGVSEEENAS